MGRGDSENLCCAWGLVDCNYLYLVVDVVNDWGLVVVGCRKVT